MKSILSCIICLFKLTKATSSHSISETETPQLVLITDDSIINGTQQPVFGLTCNEIFNLTHQNVQILNRPARAKSHYWIPTALVQPLSRIYIHVLESVQRATVVNTEAFCAENDLVIIPGTQNREIETQHVTVNLKRRWYLPKVHCMENQQSMVIVWIARMLKQINDQSHEFEVEDCLSNVFIWTHHQILEEVQIKNVDTMFGLGKDRYWTEMIKVHGVIDILKNYYMNSFSRQLLFMEFDDYQFFIKTLHVQIDRILFYFDQEFWINWLSTLAELLYVSLKHDIQYLSTDHSRNSLSSYKRIVAVHYSEMKELLPLLNSFTLNNFDVFMKSAIQLNNLMIINHLLELLYGWYVKPTHPVKNDVNIFVDESITTLLTNDIQRRRLIQLLETIGLVGAEYRIEFVPKMDQLDLANSTESHPVLFHRFAKYPSKLNLFAWSRSPTCANWANRVLPRELSVGLRLLYEEKQKELIASRSHPCLRGNNNYTDLKLPEFPIFNPLNHMIVSIPPKGAKPNGSRPLPRSRRVKRSAKNITQDHC